MKKLFLFLGVVISMQAFSQQPTGQFPFSKPQNVRGQRVNGIQVEKEFYQPITDTNFRPAQPGAIVMRPQDTALHNGISYVWTGIKWEQSGGSTSLSPLHFRDSAGVVIINPYTYYTKPQIDSLYALGYTREEIDSIVNEIYSNMPYVPIQSVTGSAVDLTDPENPVINKGDEVEFQKVYLNSSKYIATPEQTGWFPNIYTENGGRNAVYDSTKSVHFLITDRGAGQPFDIVLPGRPADPVAPKFYTFTRTDSEDWIMTLSITKRVYIGESGVIVKNGGSETIVKLAPNQSKTIWYNGKDSAWVTGSTLDITNDGVADYVTGYVAGLHATSSEINAGTGDKLVDVNNLNASKYLTQDGAKTFKNTSGTNTYTATISPSITSFSAGQTFQLRFTNANTGASTLNINGLGARDLVKNGGDTLEAGNIQAGQIYTVVYYPSKYYLAGFIPNTLPVPGGLLNFNYISGAELLIAASDTGWDQRLNEHGNILWDGARYIKVYTGYVLPYTKHTSYVGIATSTDGKTWTKGGPNGDGRIMWTGSEDPFIIRKDSTYIIYFENKEDLNAYRISAITSTDLITWSSPVEIVAATYPTNSWESTDNSSPTAFVKNDSVYLFYEGRQAGSLMPTQSGAIGLAKSADGLTGWTKYAGNPLVRGTETGGTLLPWATHCVPDDIVEYQGKYYMSIHAYNRNNFVMGMLVSDDLINWSDYLGSWVMKKEGERAGEGVMFYFDGHEYIAHYIDTSNTKILFGRFRTQADQNNGSKSINTAGRVAFGSFSPPATTDSAVNIYGGIKIVTGRQGAGKVLTSDANGGADWQTPSSAASTDTTNILLTKAMGQKKIDSAQSVNNANLALKENISRPAHTFKANNTGSTANSTDITFYSVPSQTYGGIVSFSGTASSGTADNSYSWSRVGNKVELRFNFIYTVAGAGVTQMEFPLPTDMPTQFSPPGYTANNSYQYYGEGYGTLAGVSLGTRGNLAIRKTATDNRVILNLPSGNYIGFIGSITYFTD